MKNGIIHIILASVLAVGVSILSGCAGKTAPENGTPDAVSSASQVFYQDSSLGKEQLWEAIDERRGGCTIATVNADGTPNLIVAVPAAAGDDHIYFTWADNVSKANAERTGVAMVSYYIYNADAESKSERNIGARMKVELEKDEDVLSKLAGQDPTVKAGTVFKVKEILPLG